MKEINIKEGMPVVAQARARLSQGLRIAKAGREKTVKIIHGYGSKGKGGSIKRDTLLFLEEKKREGFIKDYCKGEEFTPCFESGRRVTEQCPSLRKDRDFGRQNDGITIVIVC
ncbi:MAG: hypothetical protein RR263_03330 [Oscillospiraceae bacterium]